MANTIRIKRSTGNDAPGTLNNAELAFTEGTQTLYYGLGVSGASAAQVIAIGGSGAFATLGTAQTIGGAKTFTSIITGNVSGNAGTATTLATARNFSITGDVTATAVSFNGSADVALSATLGNSGATAGTYTKVTVNAKGLVTLGAQASLTDLASPTAAFSMSNQRLTTLGMPTDSTDAATKQYVDSLVSGLKVKTPARVATTGANIDLQNLQTIDGISLAVGDRVLVKDQTVAATNGIYVVVDGGLWTRSSDANTWDLLVAAYVFINEGTVNARTSYVTQTSAGGTLGTTSITWAQFSAPDTYSAGNGLSLVGTTFSVKANGTTITVGGDGISLSTTYSGQTSITTVGTLAVGTWNASVIGVAYGGTGTASFTTNSLVKSGAAATSALTTATAVSSTGTAGDYLDANSMIDGGTYS